MNPKKFNNFKQHRKDISTNNLNDTQNGNHSRPSSTNRKNNQTSSTLLIKPDQDKWYNHRVMNGIPLKPNSESNLTHDQITQLRTEAIHLLKTDYYNYDQIKTNGPKNEDYEWIKTVLINGTVNDKLAAYTVMIQDSPIHNLRSLELLIRFINPKGKRECMMAIDTVRDLFIADLLIPKQKLRSFEEQMNSVQKDFLLNSDQQYNIIRKKFLLLAHFEDQIRSNYRRFLDQLAQCSHDSLETMKIKSIRTMFDLFVNNPEQEKYLLECLINKLGDPTAKIASTTSRLLAQVLKHHPPMKMIIVKEVERLIFRPNITDRAQYYCLCFLSEIIFKANVDRDLANRCIKIYFAIFTKCTKLGEINNKTMSVLLTGVSRSFPYSQLEAETIEEYLNTFYRLIHYVNRNTAIQTLSLIFNMVNLAESGSLSDRFYAALYRFLLDPNLDQCNKLSLLLNIVYRSIKKDPVTKRVRAFVKRLLQLALISSSAFAISVLILVSELMKTKEGFRIDVIQTEDKDEEEKMISSSNDQFDLDDEKNCDDAVQEPRKSKSPKSWVFVDYKNQHQQEHDNSDVNKTSQNDEGYNFNARNPLFANAEYEPYYELLTLGQHFHPTVQMFARKLCNSEPIEYDGDPLEDFSLKRFLDRFSFKNPKKIDDSKTCFNKSIFRRVKTSSSSQQRANINSKEYLQQDENHVPLDERFIFKFLQQRHLMKKEQKKDAGGIDVDQDDDSDIESVDSLEFNELLDNYEKYAGGDDDNVMIDFAKDYRPTKSDNNKMNEDDEADFDEEFDDDDDDDDDMIEDDSDDDALGSDDMDDMSDNIQDDDESEEDLELDDFDDFKEIKKPRNAAPFKGKSGFSNITNDIFASAEQFDHLLDQNETDSDFDPDDDNEIKNLSSKNKKKKSNQTRSKTKRPNLGRNRVNKRKKLLKSMRQ